MKLLIDEQLSPYLVQFCAERVDPPIHAVAVAHHGLGGKSDVEVWSYAWEHDYVVVTSNAGDYLRLLNVELHPGLIVLREGSLTREEQWARLSEALQHILAQPNPDSYMVDRIIEVEAPGRVTARLVSVPQI